MDSGTVLLRRRENLRRPRSSEGRGQGDAARLRYPHRSIRQEQGTSEPDLAETL